LAPSDTFTRYFKEAFMGIFEDAIALKPEKRAKLVDALLSSLDEPDEDMDRLWAGEAEARLEAFDKGLIKAVSLKEILDKYR
jgi:hypothetical protein